MSIAIASPNHKLSGAYYTHSAVAQFLANWAIRNNTDTVLDPSFGGGVFLEAAVSRIESLGGDPSVAVFGVELDPAAHSACGTRLKGIVAKPNLMLSDFFDVDPRHFDVVLGNPPFVRYQTFAGPSRERALRRASDQDVPLPQLASSWAPFVVHSVSMLRPGGRLAMVLPMELWHASYANHVVQFLHRSFGALQTITFKRRLFPEISQDTLLVLADGHGKGPASIRWRDLGGLEDLEVIDTDKPLISGTRKLDAPEMADGSHRLTEQFIPQSARELYHELVEHCAVRRLGQLAKIGIGYVSGNNDFFHLSPSAARSNGIPSKYLAKAVRKGRALRGLLFTKNDWADGLSTGDTCYLLRIPFNHGEFGLPAGVREYLRRGQASGVDRSYKCRTRSPWYTVPHVHPADGFLTYMSGQRPRFVADQAAAVAPNNLHIVRMLDPTRCSVEMIATAWSSALSQLSVEIEGHSMGGGMLKLEPREAERIAIPPLAGQLRLDIEELNSIARVSPLSTVETMVDDAILVDGLGLSRKDCTTLRSAAVSLMQRRYSGGRH